MNYETWAETVPAEITQDSLWKMKVYRLALFLADLAWCDVTKLMRDRRTIDIAGQFYRAVSSIEANAPEGYSRGSGRDRARFYEYALGSRRESRGWYYKGRHVLGEGVATHRMLLVTNIVRLLLTMVPEQRAAGPSVLHENSRQYGTKTTAEMPLITDEVAQLVTSQDLAELLESVPMP
ncbi:MAG TPA: four helix bundle protein [Candidatus Binatia bacterium]|jgi:four helix bundle protein|nr:four helix bundle protein [Candidatus Binatia bacterium]